MAGLNRIKRVAISVLPLLILMAGTVTSVSAETPTRLDVLYADSLEPVELEANILDVNLPEGYVVVGEQIVLLVEEGEAPPPVTRTMLHNRVGEVIGVQALKVRQRVRVKGFEHSSGQIIASEIKILKQAKNKLRPDKKRD